MKRIFAALAFVLGAAIAFVLIQSDHMNDEEMGYTGDSPAYVPPTSVNIPPAHTR